MRRLGQIHSPAGVKYQEGEHCLEHPYSRPKRVKTSVQARGCCREGKWNCVLITGVLGSAILRWQYSITMREKRQFHGRVEMFTYAGEGYTHLGSVRKRCRKHCMEHTSETMTAKIFASLSNHIGVSLSANLTLFDDVALPVHSSKCDRSIDIAGASTLDVSAAAGHERRSGR